MNQIFFASDDNNIDYKYTGLDMIEGHNVDIVVENPYRWKEVADNAFDVVISGQMFEHVEFPWLTISEMARVLKPEGLMCILVPSMAQIHRAPLHCQNYFSDGLIALAKYAGLEILHASTNRAPKGGGVEWYDLGSQDSMLIARKPRNWKADNFDVENYRLVVADPNEMETGLLPMNAQKWHRKYKIKTYIRYVFFYPIKQLSYLFRK